MLVLLLLGKNTFMSKQVVLPYTVSAITVKYNLKFYSFIRYYACSAWHTHSQPLCCQTVHGSLATRTYSHQFKYICTFVTILFVFTYTHVLPFNCVLVWQLKCYSALRTVKAASSSRKHSKGKKPLGYCTYYLRKTAFLLFLLHMYVFLKY